MRRVTKSEFDTHCEEMLKKYPAAAREYAKQFAELPLQTQLSIMRRRRWLSQEAVARKLRARQPHVARVERPSHDPRLSSVLSHAAAVRCHVLLVPDELLARVARVVAAGAWPGS